MARLTREQSQELTRDRLRNAARLEFAQRGVNGASVDRIAESAGFSRGAFYSNYKSKHELLMELVAENNEQEIKVWQLLVAQATDIETMYTTLENRFDEYAHATHRWLLAAEIQLEAMRDGKFGELYQAFSDRLLVKLTEVVRDLCRKTGCPEEKAPLIAISLRAMSVGAIFSGHHSFGDFTPGAAIGFFLRSALTPPSQ
jgi:AcrR family transcriptional regulator